MIKNAYFSECGRYRYMLTREWSMVEQPSAVCIGLNPSTANSEHDDPTIRRLCSLLRHNGFGSLRMMNLFALITPYPAELRVDPNPVGENDQWLEKEQHTGNHIIFCWGNFPMADYRARKIKKMFPAALCFGQNQNGSPKHPLYLKSDTKIQIFQ